MTPPVQLRAGPFGLRSSPSALWLAEYQSRKLGTEVQFLPEPPIFFFFLPGGLVNCGGLESPCLERDTEVQILYLAGCLEAWFAAALRNLRRNQIGFDSRCPTFFSVPANGLAPVLIRLDRVFDPPRAYSKKKARQKRMSFLSHLSYYLTPWGFKKKKK